MNQAMQLLTSHASVEWYTPVWVIELVNQVMGSIDLDPASNEAANQTVQATWFYSQEEDGLECPWWGRVFLNPPYSKVAGKSSQEIWSKKLIHEYREGYVREAILLVKSALGYKWFEELFAAWPVCLMRERISFVREDGFTGQDKRGSAIFYLGQRVEKFRGVFRPYGRVILPE
jgi:phage N-6-adenine-methyltransferase